MNKKVILRGLFAAILSFVFATILSSSASYAEAVITRGLLTGEGDVRWEWQKTIDEDNEAEPEMVSIMFYDKPAATTEIVVPSLSDVITAASASESLNTYYVRSANQESQDEYFTTETRRDFGSDVTKLDMTNTSTVQIMGIAPILNPETEAELVFGENMVIGDGEGERKLNINKRITADFCTELERRGNYIYCAATEERVLENATEQMDSYYLNRFQALSFEEQRDYIPERYEFCLVVWESGRYYTDSASCYFPENGKWEVENIETSNTGVFAGYKLKLTNLENVKYLGWYAFQHTTLNEDSRHITIKANQTAGEGVFAWSNVNAVTVEGSEIYPAMFRDCMDLAIDNIDFGNVEVISYGAFENVPLNTSLDLSGIGVKSILGKAFRNTGLSGVNLGDSVEILGYKAFADNDIKDIDFPKTIKELGGKIFAGSNGIENITVRFDTYQKTLPYRLASTIGCNGSDGSDCDIRIKNLTVLPAYGENEAVSDNHGAADIIAASGYTDTRAYEGYQRHKTYTGSFVSENFDMNSFKNIISGSYFEGFSFENLVIGEGYEFIGNSAFFSYPHTRYENTILKSIQLPESLVGIGDNAFEQIANAAAEDPDLLDNYYVRKHARPEINIPSNLVYIGNFAFYMDTALYGEVNIPSLEFLGAHSFENTNITDIYFYNKLQAVGYNAFYYYTGDGAYHANGRGHIFEGKRNVTFDSDIAVNSDVGMYRYPKVMEFGTIKYTENVQHIVHLNETYFNVAIDKLDMGESNIKEIPWAMYLGDVIGEVILPHGLTKIGPESFYDTEIQQELILPEGLLEIGAQAFNCGWHWGSGSDYYYTPDNTISYGRPIKPKANAIITKLPQSLTTIGVGAFYADEGLTADIDLPNLVAFSNAAFIGTSIKKIHWYPNTAGGAYAFDGNAYLEEVYLDHSPVGSSLSDMIGGFKGYGGYYRHDKSVRYVDEMHHFKTIILGENAASSTPSFYYWISADTLDASRLNTSRIYDRMFLGVNVGELILPDNIEAIGAYAFMLANIQEELILPDTIKTIEHDAFNNTPYLATISTDDPEGDPTVGLHIPIAKLPQSLETVEYGAFYGAYTVTADVDSPSLKTIEGAAFMKSGVRDVVLHDGITTIGNGAFEYIPTLRNITIDFDFYGISGGGSRTFYNVFSTVPRENDIDHHRQAEEKSVFGDITFTDKSITAPRTDANFAFFTANKIDIANTKWETIRSATFYRTSVTEPMTLPETLETIGSSSFQEAQLTITNALSEGIKTIGPAAFFRTKINNNLVIPASVQTIGSSAFNADGVDIYYDSITVKPVRLGYGDTSGQAVFQLFWNVKMDKLTIESEELPVMSTMTKDSETGVFLSNTSEYVCVNYEDTYKGSYCLNSNGEETPRKHKPEFHGMVVREVALTNLKAITGNAFEDCPELEVVDLRTNGNLQFIGRNAFLNSDKLTKVIFDDSLVGKDVAIGEYAFKNTAIETIGINNDAGLNLAAANFNTDLPVAGVGSNLTETNMYAFAEMPALRSVSVPNNFGRKTIPAYTFANDPELAEASIAWELETIDNGAFNNDAKLAKLFVWGNANVNEDVDLTIPEQTTIFAYSDAPAEQYANAESRDAYDGKFYALDEVLYLTTNKTYVILNDEKDDFEKEGLKLYALRRDGVILQSDNWQEYTTAYSRNNVPASEGLITFEEGRGALGSDEADIAGQVYDTPKPFNTISLTNQNYQNVNFAFTQMPSSNNPLVLINYPDGYTGNIRTATLASMTKAEEEEYLRRLEEELNVPNTGVFGTIAGVATSTVSIAAIVVMGGIYVVRKRNKTC